ncbi:L-glutamate gamma-semialdehyde dehydrogenase [Planctomicrobium piriforme]|uniref:L-glutamate gamma-semialdehyde dehydrogenase n=1 Tax=Planctomicrobium piriforme TaxID=1576369 RepID=A0A1I3FJR1_9PLAN|nr:L-glutamate gamma-semialdehyde dehydrogenase [Planctomicrobium piriforme]SFI11141.1 RHH-type transcriptional regulator, proline utilization regulon repressor / proline dehydrogenase / delta 1-pyrroline-5-carboxylate dehydrogenase [Planctomicrobium piriforme]
MSQVEAKRTFAAHQFKNEPLTDFSRGQARDDMRRALQDVQAQFGQDYPLVINGKATTTRGNIVVRNPSKKSQTLGTVNAATPDLAAQAIDSAKRAWPQWRKLPVGHRAEYLELMAAEMRNRRFELAAWMVYECGKPWKEADGDVAEAIDFCMYYALAMRDLTHALTCDYPGEENQTYYRSRGVTVVIAPWNFPLAILTGMVAAALVTGNTVVMKPAEQSSIIALKLFNIARDSGLPTGVLNYLPGNGEEVGPALVRHPDVEIIAFTGSRAVGLEINRLAAEPVPGQVSVKRVIAEMGGKNAIIVDNDADLDDAVQGVVQSAFGYAGQKCSACSRVIVLSEVHDIFLERLKAACESLVVGPAEDPGCDFGPVIDQEAQTRLHDYIAIGKEECQTIVAGDVGKLAKEGFFVGPHVFANVEPESRLGQTELFGPVLSVMKARHLEHALQVANSTPYSLTGGIYSRSPKNLQRAREEFQVGNLYLNRGITGAIVQRHPFGGYRMSGIGTKAGGPDYLLQFLLPVSICENTMRRGFAPPVEEA